MEPECRGAVLRGLADACSLIALVARKISIRLRLGVALCVIIGLSFAWSVIETSQNGVWAYFSPLTRAWELALGGLVAVAAPLARRVPVKAAWVMGFAGLAAVIASGLIYNAQTPYPGSAVAVPVVGTALVIAAGTVLAGPGVEFLLRPRPVQWLGARSYSLYLWHWPLLVIPAEYAGKALTVWQNLGWVLLALVLSMISYRLIENPIRKARPARCPTTPVDRTRRVLDFGDPRHRTVAAQFAFGRQRIESDLG